MLTSAPRRSTYSAAARVAPEIAAYLKACHDGATSDLAEELAPLPDTESIEGLIDIAFWTSLKREERFSPRVSLVYTPPSKRGLHFAHPLPLCPSVLSRIAPGIERPGVHLGVWPVNGSLIAWGTTEHLPRLSLSIQTLAPGHLVLKCRPQEGAAKFINIAVLEGEEVKLLNHRLAPRVGKTEIFDSLLGAGPLSQSTVDPANILVRLAISMREHQRGGTLLVVPRERNEWRDSIAQPIHYAISPPYRGLSDLLGEYCEESAANRWYERLAKSVSLVAGFTAIDGAAIINDAYEVLGFGAKIVRRQTAQTPEFVLIEEPTEASEPTARSFSQLGGTRHMSAALFTFEQRDSLALVASQDGPFTIFAWSPLKETVVGYPVDALLG